MLTYGIAMAMLTTVVIAFAVGAWALGRAEFGNAGPEFTFLICLAGGFAVVTALAIARSLRAQDERLPWLSAALLTMCPAATFVATLIVLAETNLRDADAPSGVALAAVCGLPLVGALLVLLVHSRRSA